MSLAVLSLILFFLVWPLGLLPPGYTLLLFYPLAAASVIWRGFYAGLLFTAAVCLLYALAQFAPAAPIFKSGGIDILILLNFAVSGTVIALSVAAFRQAHRHALENAEKIKLTAGAEAERSAFIGSIINAIPDMIGYWHKDLRFGYANDAYVAWFGKRPDSLIGTHVRDLMGEHLFALNEPLIRAALAGESQQFQRTLTKTDGSLGYLIGNYIPDIGSDGEVKGIHILASEVTRLKEAEADLELAANVFENTFEGILVTDGQGVILSVNPAFTAITGYSAKEVIGHTPRVLKSNRHDTAFYESMWGELNDNGRWKGDIWNRRKNGEIFPERITITRINDSAGAPIRYVSVFSDITDLWREDEYIKHLAFHDALTDLPNRALLIERLQHRIEAARRNPAPLSIMFLDLDQFKFVNDTYGHDVGDELLRVIGKRLVALIRQSDTVSRIGGDEFIIKLNNVADRRELAQVAERVVATINEPMEIRGATLTIGTSIGIASFPEDGISPEDLMKSADVAMYAAKSAGKNTFRFFRETDARAAQHPA
jgi:diguanylate cyclase (GGDEF)-like protein/PAS domain S-box-containing protein